MTKRDIIDRIVELNRSARPEFLSRFTEADLLAYLRQLEAVATPRKDQPQPARREPAVPP